MFLEKKLSHRDYSPLALAYIGDSVYDLFIRSKVIERGNRHVTDMHKAAVSFVNAAAQAAAVHAIEGMLDENEDAILKWGRNAKSGVPKHADVTDYRFATGLETLLGSLYVEGEFERLKTIMEAAYASINNNEGEM